MSASHPAALYLCYYHVEEALVRSQVIAYLHELATRGYGIHLLTFEKARLSRERQSRIRADLAAEGIQWHALRYHAWPSLPATLFDITAGFAAAVFLSLRHRLTLLHARSHVPAAMALAARAVLPGRRFLFDFRGLLAEEYADAGHWQPSQLKYRLTKAMERRFFARADGFVLLTERIRKDLAAELPVLASRAEDVTVIPCCADTTRFAVSASDRTAYREFRDWSERRVLTYLGKLSDLYLPEEMARFFAALRRVEHSAFFQVLTPSDSTALGKALRAHGVDRADYDVRHVDAGEVPRVLAASDATISFRKGELSRRAASPTKLAESLAAGLPVVTNAGIGDCDGILLDQRLGVVLSGFGDADHDHGAGQLAALLEDVSLAARCRAYAERELSLSHVGGPRYAAVYRRLIGPVA